jgi:glycerophosphoryl diester phosphodiesterase
MPLRPEVTVVRNRFLGCLCSPRDRPLVFAHRGDSAHAPENTLEAARLGWEAGADAWELDVQLTRDGVAVVLHDDTLDRTTDVAHHFAGDPRGPRRFRASDFDWQEVQTLDAGSWFLAQPGAERSAVAFGTLHRVDERRRALYGSGKVRVPTLVDALELTCALDWLVNVEIKSLPESPPGLVEAVIRAIEQTGAADRVLLSSFDHHQLHLLASLTALADPAVQSIPLGVLTATPLAQPHLYVTEVVGAQTYHISAQCLGADSLEYRCRPSAQTLTWAELASLKSRGIPILVYTVNDARPGGLADHLGELGVDGIFTDDPAGILARFTARSAAEARARSDRPQRAF